MSAEGPESIPTSADPKSHRPTKRRALTPSSAQADSVNALFAKPDQEIRVPDTSSSSSALAKLRAPPPEIVTNVQGSSAGAGSGEFHVYKAARRREYERLREMDEEVRKEKDREVFDKEKSEREKRDEEKTRKNREKREKMKARKAKKGKGNNGGGTAKGTTDKSTANGEKKPANGTAAREDGQGGQKDDGDTSREDKSTEAPTTTAAQAPGLIIHDDD